MSLIKKNCKQSLNFSQDPNFRKKKQVFKRQKTKSIIPRNNLPSYQAALEGYAITGEKPVESRRWTTRLTWTKARPPRPE